MAKYNKVFFLKLALTYNTNLIKFKMKTQTLLKQLKLLSICIAVTATSCTNEGIDEVINQSDENIKLVDKYFRGDLIQVEELDGGDYKWGDIIFNEAQITDEKVVFERNISPDSGIDNKLGLAYGVRKWTNNTIVYVIASGFSQRVLTEIQASMDEWTNKTNVRFKERTNESNYVTIRPNGQSCNCGSANLGMNGSNGRVNLGSGSTRGVIIHEFGHTLGYIHEQNRSDRDQFVDIFPENIQDGALSQFSLNSNSINPGSFDSNSTMIYSSFTFSKNGQPVMLLKNGDRIPFNNGLSSGDISGTNILYPADTSGEDSCEGVAEWVSGTQYNVGDRVVYQGYLYERDFDGWNRILECDEPVVDDICENVPPYSSSTNYSVGDKVTYQGYLFELQSNYSWLNLGRCNN